MRRKKGISLLIPTQNSEKTVELCIKSFIDFADEIIVVDNGSKDNTIDIMLKIQKEFNKVKFFNKPELIDLYHNRQFAFEQSIYDWIVRIDSDYIAYNSGENNIVNLREFILSYKKTLLPTAFTIKQVNLIYDFYHTGIPKENRKNGEARFIPPPTVELQARIIQYYPGMKFTRIGRWEGIRWQKFLYHKKIDKIYWFHCDQKSDMNYFYRSERSNWRELGNFKEFPTLEHYVKYIIKTKYSTDNMEKACKIYMDKEFFPFIVKYDSNLYYQYPELIKGL